MDEITNKLDNVVINKNKNELKQKRKQEYEKRMKINRDKLIHKLNEIGDSNNFMKHILLSKIDRLNKNISGKSKKF